MPHPRAHAARHPRTHAGGADVDHDGGSQRVDLLEQRVMTAVIDREVLHDRMEVKADEAEFAHGFLHLPHRDLDMLLRQGPAAKSAERTRPGRPPGRR